MQADTDIAERPAWPEAQRRVTGGRISDQQDGGGGGFFKSDLPKKLGILVVSLLTACVCWFRV